MNDYLNTKKKQNCYGCSACVQICPMQCITMQEDGETFLYPNIDSNKCINCGLCHKVCPFNMQLNDSMKIDSAIIATDKDPEIIFKSSSGGAFTNIANIFCDDNTIVVGVCYDENLCVVHEDSRFKDGIDKFRKSKYVQSNVNNTFKKIKQYLIDKKSVMFIGTPCQCAGLRCFLNKEEISNLLVVDLVCHGAPSQKLFNKHLNEISSKSKCISFGFRNKRKYKGLYNSRTAYIEFCNGDSEIVSADEDMYLKAYYSRLCYRPSCKNCRFACPQRVSDITIADAWGIERTNKKLNPLKGVSLILFNTKKGKAIKNNLEAVMDTFPIDVEWAIMNNEQLRKPTEFHKNRAVFFKSILRGKSFSESVERATKVSTIIKIKRKIGNIYRRLLKYVQ